MNKVNFRIIHPFLFGLFPIMLIYSNNSLEIILDSLFLPVTIIFSIIAISIVILRISIKNLDKSLLIISLSVILFFNIEHIRFWIESLELSGIEAHHLTLILYLTVFPLILFLIYKIKDAEKPSKIIAVVSIAILVSFIPNFFIYSENESSFVEKLDIVHDTKFFEKPDVYFILLDGYSSNESLNEDFGYDNSPFLNELKNEKFMIADNIFSNYLWTAFAMTSIFNMQYTHDIPDSSIHDQVLYKEMFTNNILMNIFKNNGYEVIYIDGGGPWREMKIADEVLCKTTDNRLLQTLIETSVMKYIYGGFTSQTWNDIRDCAFEELIEVSQNNQSPMFVYAHIRSPHPPYTVDDFGKSIEYETTDDENILNERYINQLKYTNEKLKHTLSNLLSTKDESIIILLSDHGTNNLMDFDHTSAEDLIQAHANFGAYYLPGNLVDERYNSASPVNIFRLILNDYFEGDFDILEDSAFFIEHDGFRPIDENVIDITEFLN